MNCLVLLVFPVLLGFLYLRISLVIVTVQGRSMSPTLHSGDRVLVWRHYLPRWLKIGQIVLVDRQREQSVETIHVGTKPTLVARTSLIKRVIGLPGDTVITRLTGLPKFEQQHQLEFCNERGERVWYIPHGHFFIKSDLKGLDSSTFGPVPFSNLLGVVLMKLPVKRIKKTDKHEQE
jgi:signal peptidase I